MPSSSRTSAFARRAKRCAAEPSRANSVSSLRDAGVKKPRRILPTVESQSRRLARGIFGFSQSRGIHNTVEVYDPSGRTHHGDFDPWDGRQIGQPDKTRTVEP